MQVCFSLCFRFLFIFCFLQVFISCREELQENSILITGSSTVAPLVADAAKRFEEKYPGARIDVQTGGSSRGIADADCGLADLGMASRELKAGEGNLLAHRIAVDGVCLIVHRSNSVSDLSREEVKKIFTKEITNWKTVGGPDSEIVVANKADGTGTLEVFLDYVDIDSSDIHADVIVAGNQQAIKTVAGNPNAVGYVSIGAASSEEKAGTPIRLLRSDSIAPIPEEVAGGSFPIKRPLLVLQNPGKKSELISSFLAFLQSDEITDLIESHLYVPIAK